MDSKLIVIEGLDGCGKSTQLELLKNQFKSCEFITFPCYDKPSGEVIKQYLSGEIHEENDNISAYTASTFYAIDRYISYKTDWEKAYKGGRPIISARYVSSNAIYQMTKLPSQKWDGFLEWLEDFEYVKCGIPKPNIVIYLDMPLEVSQKLLSERYNGDETKKDIHESNLGFMKACHEAAEYVAIKQDWKIISCSKNGQARSVSDINRELTHIIENYLFGING